MGYKGVVFDMDGLMFDTEALTYQIWEDILRKYNYNFTLEFYKETVGKRSVEVVEMYKQRFGADFDYQGIKSVAMNKFWDYTKNNGVPQKEGLVELLEFLKKNHIKIALATSTTTKSATEILTRAGVLKYFDALVCGDMVTNGKPNPEVFATAVKKLHLTPQECIGLEDSFNGVISSNEAGLVTVMVPDLIMPTKEIEDRCYKVVSSLSQVIDIIKE